MSTRFRIDNPLAQVIQSLRGVLGADSDAQVIEKAIALARIAGEEARGDKNVVKIGEQTISLNT